MVDATPLVALQPGPERKLSAYSRLERCLDNDWLDRSTGISSFCHFGQKLLGKGNVAGL
jgi:hypothetical protein